MNDNASQVTLIKTAHLEWEHEIGNNRIESEKEDEHIFIVHILSHLDHVK